MYNTNRQRTLEMSQDVASKQPLISTALEVKPAAEDQNQQRKCGVHRLQVFGHTRFLFKDSKRVMPKICDWAKYHN